MRNWVDKLLLFCCCLTVYLCEPLYQRNVLPVLAAVIAGGLLAYFEREKLRAVLAGGFVAVSLFLPGLPIFLPVVFYDVTVGRCWFLYLAGAAPITVLWQQAKFTTAAFASLLFVVGLCIRHRTRALETLRAQYTEMRDTAKELELRLKRQNSDLMEKQDYEISIATLNERNRIAREIHDSVGHLLSSSLLQVGALLSVNRDDAVRDGLVTVKETLSSAMDSIRVSVHDLYDDSVDLYAQVRGLTDAFSFCPVSLDYDIRSSPSRRLKYAFIAIVREALSNMMRHSNATAASVTFREHPALYQLVISDNGTVKNYRPENGIGLQNIAQRAQSFGGLCSISAENGFRIFISVPKEKNT